MEKEVGDCAEEKTPILEGKDKHDRTLKTIGGLVAAFLVVPLTVASYSCVQLLKREFPDLELNTVRCLVASLCWSVGLIFLRKWPIIPKSEIFSTAVFGIFLFCDGVGTYIAVTLVPVASVKAIHATGTLISGIILFACFVNERVTLKLLIFVSLCVVGIMLIIQPKLTDSYGPSTILNISAIEGGNSTGNGSDLNISISGSRVYTDTGNGIDLNNSISGSGENPEVDKNGDSGMFSTVFRLLFGYGLSFFAGFSWSCGVLIIKKQEYMRKNKTDVLFWVFLIGTLLSAIATSIFESPILPKSWMHVSLIFIHSAVYAAMWPLMMFSAKTISGNTITLICSMSIVGMLIPQYTVLSSIHPGNRNWMEVVGVVLVLLGSSFGSLFEFAKQKIIRGPKMSEPQKSNN